MLAPPLTLGLAAQAVRTTAPYRLPPMIWRIHHILDLNGFHSQLKVMICFVGQHTPSSPGTNQLVWVNVHPGVWT
jgi:hypothetical protein